MSTLIMKPVCDLHASLFSCLLNSDRPKGRTQAPVVAHQQDVSTAAIGEWEKELMEDPKVRE